MPRLLRIGTLAILALALTAFISGCERMAEMIPGEIVVTPTLTHENSTPTPVLAPPIIPPGTITVSDSEPKTTSRPDSKSDTELALSVVQLQIFDDRDGFALLVRNGSGVIVDETKRLLLTSYTLVDPFLEDGSPAYSSIVVGVTREPGKEPSLEFEAKLVAADRDLGLAVLRVTRMYPDASVDTGQFDLPSASLGTADELAHGDKLRMLGYSGAPHANNDDSQVAVAATATITGFHGDALIKGRAWLKTDVRLPGGITGGPAFDTSGRLVGIATQILYDPDAVVAKVRPLTLANDLLENARKAPTTDDYLPPLHQSPSASVSAGIGAENRIIVSIPALAENAVQGDGILNLFDYTNEFYSRPPAIYYEYSAQGIPDGTLVEEKWYLDGVLQDALSSSFTWVMGPFGVVADSLIEPSPRGIQAGIWVLEVWVNAVLRSASTARVAIDINRDPPSVASFEFRSFVSDKEPLNTAPSSQEHQLIAFFDYEDAGAATQMRWIVFRDGKVEYQSPLVPWTGGIEGQWWVGFSDDNPIGPGFWEFEIYLNGPDQPQPIPRGTAGVQVP